MFEYFLKKNNKTFAYDNKSELKEFVTTKNIENILTTSNNIEEIENILSNTNEEYKSKKILTKIDKIDSIIATILIIIGTIIFSASNLLLLTGILLFLISNGITIASIINDKKIDQAYNINLDVLVKELTIENEKLNELKKKDEIDNNHVITHKIYINKSERIKNLYKKLELINFFIENDTKLIRLYKSDILNFELQKNFSIDDIIFITFLIEQEINNKQQIKKEQQKIKTIK